MKALAIAATGMSAQQLNVEVIANNISKHEHHRLQAGACRIHRPSVSGRACAGSSQPHR